MSYSSQAEAVKRLLNQGLLSPEQASRTIRALVEGGLRMINNAIPDVPASATRKGAVQVAPVQGGGTQLRLPLTQPGRGAQAYSPTKSSTPEAAAEIQSARRALPAESASQRNQRLLEQAQESRLLMQPTGGVRAGMGAPEFSEYVFGRARTPRTVSTTAAPAATQPQAPVPAWARAQQLQIADPQVYQAVRQIAESTARERGVRAEDVMEALLSPEGTQSGLLRTLSAPGEMVPSGGGRMGVPNAAASATQGPSGALARTGGLAANTQEVIPATVYEVTGQQKVLPEGDVLRMLNELGGVRTIDLRQALATPDFIRAMGSQLADFAAGPVAADVAEAGAAAGRRVPLAPFVGGGMLGGLGLGAYMSQQQNQIPGLIEPSAPGETMLGAPTATPEAGANLPAVTGSPLTQPAAPIAGSTNAIPGTVNPSSLTQPAAPVVAPPRLAGGGSPAAARPVVSATGAGAVVQQMNDGDSNYRQAVQNASQALRQDATQYGPGQAGAFYAAQQAYARTPGRSQEIVGSLKQMGAPASVGIESEANFETWARKNPELAYRLQLQMQRRGPSQQMPTAQGVQVGTSFGTDFNRNALGQSRAAAENAVTGKQGAADIADALRPQAYATMQAPRSGMYAGY